MVTYNQKINLLNLGKVYFLALFLLLFASTVLAEIPVPALSKRVTDLTATLTAEQNTALENKLAAFEAKKGSQIAVLILPTTQGEDVAAFGMRVFDAWKIGRKNIDDGVILIVAKNDRKLRLEIGRGLEGAIPDAIAKRILAETIKPHFQINHYFRGIDAGVNQIIGLIEGELLSPISNAIKTKSDSPSVTKTRFDSLFVVYLILFFIYRNKIGFIFVSICFFLSAIAILYFDLNFWAVAITGILLFFILEYFYGGKGTDITYFGNNNDSNCNSDWSSNSGGFSGGGGESSGGGSSDSW